MNIFEESIDLGGQKLTLQTGKLAPAATVAMLGRLGDTTVLVTVTASRKETDLDYFPLSVEYVEKLYAGGRIKGSRWVKREGRPTDDAVLKGRIIDRSIRPLFPKGFRKDVQIVCTLLSVDGVNAPEIVAAITVSAALHASPIPWNGPISTMRVGYVPVEGEDTYVVNPTTDDMKYSTLDLIVSSTKEKVVMIETQAEQVGETNMLNAIRKAKETNVAIISFIESIREKVGMPKEIVSDTPVDEKLIQTIKHQFQDDINTIIAEKTGSEGAKPDVGALIETVSQSIGGEYGAKQIAQAIDYVEKKTIHDKILETGKHIDGRPADEIRSLNIEVSLVPRIHGSALFQRGQTQVMSIVTLAAPALEQLIEGPEGEEAKHYIHHYYSPPYSYGDVGRLGFVSRREIGHGALAEKAIEPVLPSEKDFPYTIRVVSEVLSSNGSTSMASTCGSTLALMDAGVPIKAPVAGIAMGFASRSDDDYVILTDIIGLEDFSGEMDFKIAGTTEGITAIQLDVKNNGLTDKVIEETFEKARSARLFLLDRMAGVISQPRVEVSQFAPRVVVLTPPEESIGTIIGPGGKTIRSIIAKTGTNIEVGNDGNVVISGLDKTKVEEAVTIIENMTREVGVGEVYSGTVKRMLAFGAFIELFPGKEGLLHVSKMGPGFVRDPADLYSVGQEVEVKVDQIDQQGRINLILTSQPESSDDDRGRGQRDSRASRHRPHFKSPRNMREHRKDYH